MSLKEATKEKHTEAESTPFMKAVFNKTLPRELWVDWIYQKIFFYNIIETSSIKLGILDEGLRGLPRTPLLAKDFNEMNQGVKEYDINPAVKEYYIYLTEISTVKNKMLAHLYTWHLGDMYGGQMIKRIVPGPHNNLEFEDSPRLMSNLRSKLDDSLADEANVAFTWAIKMMREYDSHLEQN